MPLAKCLKFRGCNISKKPIVTLFFRYAGVIRRPEGVFVLSLSSSIIIFVWFLCILVCHNQNSGTASLTIIDHYGDFWPNTIVCQVINKFRVSWMIRWSADARQLQNIELSKLREGVIKVLVTTPISTTHIDLHMNSALKLEWLLNNALITHHYVRMMTSCF